MAKLALRVSRTVLIISSLLVIVGIIGLFFLKTSPIYADSISPTLVLNGERIAHSSIATADFDGDGDKELVIGGQDGMLYVIAYQSGSWSVAWSRQTAVDLNAAGAPSDGCDTTKSDIRSAAAIGDLDNDGHLDIVVTTGGDTKQHRNGGVLVYRYNSNWSFSLVPGWPQPKLDIVGSGSGSSNPDGCWDGIWSSPALGDLDGDGDLEIVVEGFDRRLHAWHHTGTYVTGWPISRDMGDAILRGGWSSPALGDIDDDGLPEVVVGTDSPPWEGEGGAAPDYSLSTVWAINGDSSNVPGWPVVTDQTIQSSPALGDIDGDGALEIVVGTGNGIQGQGYKVYAWESNGQAVSGWPQATGGYMPASPALGDLDGDGDLEIVVGCGAEGDPYPASCTDLYAWHGNGIRMFTVSPPPNNPWTPPGPVNGLPYAPVLADYDGDGFTEILVLNRWSWGISTVRYDSGSGSWVSSNDALFRSSNTLESTPVVEDVDGDGQLEVVIGGADSGGSHGALYVWNVAGDADADADAPWPMFRRDVARTGAFPNPPHLQVVPGELWLMHQSGSTAMVSGAIFLQNRGAGQFDWSVTQNVASLLTVDPSSGTFPDVTSFKFTVDPTGFSSGWHDLGELQVSATSEGTPIEGSPKTVSVRLYVGDVFKLSLPVVTKFY